MRWRTSAVMTPTSLRLLLALALSTCAACRDSEAVFPDAAGSDPLLDAAEDAGTLPEGDAAGAADVRFDPSRLDALPLEDSGEAEDGGPGDDDATPGQDAVRADAAPRRDAGDAGAPVDSGPVFDPLAPLPGDLVIVEVQGNPQNTADDTAEYIELLNVSGRDLDLQDCTLLHHQWAGSGMAPVQSANEHRIRGSVPVPAGARVLLTRGNGGYFGGATRDYVYGDFELSNGASDNNRLRLMGPLWDGREPPAIIDLVDELVMPRGTFDNDLRGRAWQLDPADVPAPSAALNDDPASWCHAASGAALAYWMNNWGTPGAANACN